MRQKRRKKQMAIMVMKRSGKEPQLQLLKNVALKPILPFNQGKKLVLLIMQTKIIFVFFTGQVRRKLRPLLKNSI